MLQNKLCWCYWATVAVIFEIKMDSDHFDVQHITVSLQHYNVPYWARNSNLMILMWNTKLMHVLGKLYSIRTQLDLWYHVHLDSYSRRCGEVNHTEKYFPASFVGSPNWWIISVNICPAVVRLPVVNSNVYCRWSIVHTRNFTAIN